MHYFFKRKIEKLLQFTFEKNNLLCKKREKNHLLQGKIPAPPPPLDIKWSVPYNLPNNALTNVVLSEMVNITIKNTFNIFLFCGSHAVYLLVMTGP